MGKINRVERKKWLEKSGYEHSCFISWPRSHTGSTRRFLKKLRRSIIEEAVKRGLPKSAFVDFHEIQLGDPWLSKMSGALCRSISLIAICGPDYYESDYCGREWAGMEVLKARRAPDAPSILPLGWQPLRSQVNAGLYQDEVVPKEVERLQVGDLSRLRLLRSD